jgi:hypothetical protein
MRPGQGVRCNFAQFCRVKGHDMALFESRDPRSAKLMKGLVHRHSVAPISVANSA